MGDIFIHYLNLPFSVEGFAKKNTDDSYSIIINARYSREKQKQALLHELQHIEGNDFESEEDAVEIEKSRKKRL